MDIKSIVKNIEKQHGEGTAKIGMTELEDNERTPTGVFAFDLASGGGFPQGKISVVYGPESSGKTNLALRAVAQHQRLHPEQQCVFLDIENSFDPKWSAALGVDVNKLVYLLPTFAEEAIDMFSAVIEADDVGMVVVDSVAALIPSKEADSSAERQQVGGNSLLVGNMMRKAIFGLIKAQKKNVYPTVVLLNQIRTKIGVMFGNPENMPGGHALKHASGLTVRVYGKNKVIKEVSATLPAVKETSVIINKWKVPIVAANAQYEMAMIPHKGLKPGDTDDWNTLSTYLRDMELLVQHGKGTKKKWLLEGEEFDKLVDIKVALYGDHNRLQKLKQRIISAQIALAQGGPIDIHGEQKESVFESD